jgi:hypothetical protein
MRVALVHRRLIWVPTIWGWLALLLIGTAIIALITRNLHSFLAPNAPVGARTLVVEGWLEPGELDQAVTAFRSRSYERIVTTGGPIHYSWAPIQGPATFAERARDYLKKRLPDASLTAVPAPDASRDQTYLSGVMVREWARRSGITFKKLDIFSSGVHARRSRLLYRLAFGPSVAVGVISARSASNYDPNAWWRTTTGARIVLDEAIRLIWVECFFWPPPPGSHEERELWR